MFGSIGTDGTPQFNEHENMYNNNMVNKNEICLLVRSTTHTLSTYAKLLSVRNNCQNNSFIF